MRDRVSHTSRRRAIFLDRDGVINRNRADYVKEWDEFEFEEGSLEGLALLAQTDFCIIVASNQSALARNLLSTTQLDEIHKQMCEAVQAAGGRIDRIFYCPHGPQDNCDCRKPKPGMLYLARDDMDIDLSQSYFVGDSLADLSAGAAVGCTTVLVRTGRGLSSLEQLQANSASPSVVVNNLYDAAALIVYRERISTS